MSVEAKEKEILKILNRKAPGTIAIFECKGFYRCYGTDASVIAEQILMSNVGIQFVRIAEENMPYHNLNNAQYLRAVRDLLLLLRFRVELYEEGSANYVLKAKGVLGNLVDFEDILSECVELAELSTIGCIHIVDDDLALENKLSLAFCNSQDLRIILAELDDTPKYSQLEQCISSLQPRECVLFKGDVKTAPNRFKKLDTSIKRTGSEKTIVDIRCPEDMEECKKSVKKLFQKNFLGLNLSSNHWQTLYTILSHMQVIDDTQYESAFSVMHWGAAGHMFLSNTVLQALDIFATGTEMDAQTSRLPSNSISTSLHDHLNRCRSQAGKRLLRDWLRRPLFSHRQIEERLDVVEAFCNCSPARQSLHEDLLRRVPDIDLLTRKLVQKKATLQDCYRLYQLILLLRKIENVLRSMQEDMDGKFWASVKELILEQIQHSKIEFERFRKLVESTLDLDFFEQSGQHRIKPEIDEELASIAEQIKELDERAQKLLSKLANKMNCEVKLESNIELGYFFRITLKSEAALRSVSNVKVLDSTKGGGVRFNTSLLEQLNEEFRSLSQAYETGQVELTKLVVETCAGYVPALQSLSQRIGVLDVLSTFSVVVASSPTPYVRPKILENGTNVLNLQQCRHPVIEHTPGMQFIPNDLNMNKETNFIVLTGANMGGKSTYLKATALTILLGQIGCFVPCQSATFSMIDGIYTRIGAGDFQVKGVSTFMAEMIDCTTILENATANSLILIDELGRGTSTYDGFGLAWAIAKDVIRRIRCFSLFATHFHEISRLEKSYPGKVKNYRMDTLIEEGRLTILFHVVPGVADRSFGLNIAEMVGFPQEILKDAGNILHQLENFTSEGSRRDEE